MKKYLAYTLLMLFAFIVSSCSEGQKDYYPHSKGLTRTYQQKLTKKDNNNKTEKEWTIERKYLAQKELKGELVTPIETLKNGKKKSFLFIKKESSGYRIFASQKSGSKEPEIWDSQDYFIKFPIQVGTSWDYESKTYLVKEKFPIQLKAKITSLNDSVTVPAGTFQNCLKVEYEGTKEVSFPFIGIIKFNKKVNEWYAPGVGWIKNETIEECTFTDIGMYKYTYELTDYK